MSGLRISSTIVLAGVFHATVCFASLHQVWQINLAASVRKAEGRAVKAVGVTALRFSPDGRRIAVAVAGYRGSYATRLLIVDAESPQNAILQFELRAHATADDEFRVTTPPVIAWSPDGTALIAGSDVFELRAAKSCTMPGIGVAGWVTSDEAVAYASEPNRLEFFDADCHSRRVWQLNGVGWDLLDISPDHGLVALLKKTSAIATSSADIVVGNVKTDEFVQRWPSKGRGYIARFTDDGKIICVGEGGDHTAPPELHPQCMDVDSGKTVAQATNILGGGPFAAADRVSRIVASDHRASWNFLFHEADTVLKRRVVWDIHANREIASWKPERESFDTGGPRQQKRNFMFAISPDGQYIAEGGNGILRLSKIEAGTGQIAKTFSFKSRGQ